MESVAVIPATGATDVFWITDLTLRQLWVMLRARGKGSSEVDKQPATLYAAGRCESGARWP